MLLLPSLSFRPLALACSRLASSSSSTTLTRKITESDLRAFSEVSGDHNAIHAGPGAIVHGVLLAGVVSAAIARHWPGAILATKDLAFRRPCPVGTTVVAAVAVEDDSRKLAVLAFKVHEEGDEGKVFVEGKTKVKLPKKQS